MVGKEIVMIILSMLIFLTSGLWYGISRKKEEDANKNNQLDEYLSYSLILMAIGVIILLVGSVLLTRKHCPVKL